MKIPGLEQEMDEPSVRSQKNWANYKGLYHHGENVVISYAVGID